ncbi:MAG TPA: TIGR00289 family protein, partial [Thermoplasmata archaeon]|nr:TIGR00289 family protein [Thermoplasmata archaeon]
MAALFSGGKDSTYAIYVAQQRGWEVTHLISIHPADPASMLYHVPNLHLTPLLAEALRIPLVQEEAGAGEDAELDALRRAIRR